MTQLTPHFSVAEFEHSPTANQYGISNRMGPAETKNARALCEHVLEKIRAHYGQPVLLTSGFRSRAVNSKIGGAADSQHTKGEAADIQVGSVSPEKLFRDIVTGKIPGLVFDQVIQEFGRWVHISYRRQPGGNRNQRLRAINDNGKIRYFEV